MKKKHILPWLLAGLCVVLVLVWALYPVRTPYQYPTTFGSEEWKAMTPQERWAVCNVPVGLMERMTTEALAETVLNNPQMEIMASRLVISSYMPPDYRRFYDYVEMFFQGTVLLEKRKDGRAVLEKIYAETKEEENSHKRQYIRYILAAWDQGPSEPTFVPGGIPIR